MSTSDDHTADETHQSYLVYLLVSLVFILLIVPAIEHSSIATDLLLRVGITAVLVSAAVATRRRKAILILGLFVACVAAPVSWMTMFFEQPLLFLFSCLLEGVFFIMMAILILITVIRRHLATVHSIFGAISAYLLLGLAWAVFYWGINHLDTDALAFTHLTARPVVVGEQATEVAGFSQFVYFSFVTMSTLGYGDVTPQNSVVRTLAWMQSVTGQFYMAVLVAWMVSEIPRARIKKSQP
ncbi:MAG: ion channel [Pirellulaceae bacterium]|jgi:hypothetical protein|nr:ion channel [Pirellulaceae bacterium]MDP6723429.1 ion channel [Pirellulaceae bacterium]